METAQPFPLAQEPEGTSLPKPLRLQPEYLALRARQKALQARGQDAAADITQEIIAYVQAYKASQED